MHWTISGVQRDALVFAPRAAHGAAKHPLVVAFHGHGGRMLSTSVMMNIHAVWPQAIVVYPQGLNTPTVLDPEGRVRLAGESGRLRRPGSQAVRRDRRDDEAVLRGGQAPDLRNRILKRRRLQPAAVGRASEDDRRDQRGRRSARPVRDPDLGAGAPRRGRTERHGRPVCRPAANDPACPRVNSTSHAGSPCGRYCSSTPRRPALSRSRPSSTQEAMCTPAGRPPKSSSSSKRTGNRDRVRIGEESRRDGRRWTWTSVIDQMAPRVSTSSGSETGRRRGSMLSRCTS